MIDDFLTTPDDVPPPRGCGTDGRSEKASARFLAADASGSPTLAASVVLVVAMITLPSFSAPTPPPSTITLSSVLDEPSGTR